MRKIVLFLTGFVNKYFQALLQQCGLFCLGNKVEALLFAPAIYWSTHICISFSFGSNSTVLIYDSTAPKTRIRHTITVLNKQPERGMSITLLSTSNPPGSPRIITNKPVCFFHSVAFYLYLYSRK